MEAIYFIIGIALVVVAAILIILWVGGFLTQGFGASLEIFKFKPV
jgi:hypothetical protein